LLNDDRFAEACSARATRKDTPLANLLVERGWLTPGDRAGVEKLLVRKLDKHGDDAGASLPGFRKRSDSTLCHQPRTVYSRQEREDAQD
jgi:hypothetical protein